MTRTVFSVKGEPVNFDLLQIKSAMAALPIDENSANRERFVNRKRRRSVKNRVDDILQHKRLEVQNFNAAIANMPTTPIPDEPPDETVPNDDSIKRRKVK